MLAAPELFEQRQLARWTDYQKELVDNFPKGKSSHVAYKSLETMIANWRSAAGAITQDGITPSVTAPWFNGLRAWDRWK